MAKFGPGSELSGSSKSRPVTSGTSARSTLDRQFGKRKYVQSMFTVSLVVLFFYTTPLLFMRELEEELGVTLPMDAFELLFVFLQECVTNGGTFINNEYNDVYLVTMLAPIPLEAFTLQDSEVSAVKYIACDEYRELLSKEDPKYVPYDVNEQYGQLFNIIGQRYKQNAEERSLALQKQLNRYASISLSAELDGVSDADTEALKLLVKAARTIDDIFHEHVWYSNPDLRNWLKEHADTSPLAKLKWKYYMINTSPWSCLDENKAFLTTANSPIKLLSGATKSVSGWKGL